MNMLIECCKNSDFEMKRQQSLGINHAIMKTKTIIKIKVYPFFLINFFTAVISAVTMIMSDSRHFCPIMINTGRQINKSERQLIFYENRKKEKKEVIVKKD